MYAISMVEMPKVHELEHGECGGFGAMMAKKMRAIGNLTPFLVLVTGIPPSSMLASTAPQIHAKPQGYKIQHVST